MSTKASILSALWFFLFVSFLDRVAISFAGPSMMASLSLTPARFGIILSSFGIGYLLAQIPSGIFADRWGGKLLLVTGPLFWAAFTGMSGLVTTVAAFVIARIGLGLSEGIPSTAVHKTIGDHFETKQRAGALALISTAIPLAPAFAGVLVGQLIGAYGWQTMFLVMAGPALLASLSSYLLLPKRVQQVASDVETGNTTTFRNAMTNPSLWLLSATSFAFSIGYWGYQGWMPSYLALERHIDLSTLGMLGSVPYVFAFFGLLTGGWLGSGRLHSYRLQLVACCYFLSGLGLFLAFQASTVSLSVAGLSAAAFFLYALQGPVGAIWLDVAPPRYRARYIGVINTCGHLGGAIAPAVIGALVGATGTFAGGFAFMIAALCVAAGCMLALVRLPRPKASSEPQH